MSLVDRAGGWVLRQCAEGRWLHSRLLRHRTRLKSLAFWITVALYPLFCLLAWLRLLWRRITFQKPKIVWAPTPIINISENSKLLNQIGYDSKTVVFTVYHITSDFDVNLKPHIRNPAVGYWLPNALFLWSLLKFDVFHFFFDGGLWSGMKIVPRARWLEIPLLRLAGKRVIATAYGADVRVRSWNEHWQPYNLCQECPDPGRHCICDTEQAEINIRYHRSWCNALLAMGDMHDFVFGSRREFLYWPIDVKSVEFAGAEPHDGTINVVHSPNHRHFKGTRFIEAAVEALREKGLDVELHMVEKMSNEEARRAYAEADIVVAQCIAGWFGFTEIEAMAAGKPLVSYLRDADRYLGHVPGCPVVSANPDRLEAELERLVLDGELRAELGRRNRDYAERVWSYEAIGPQYDALHREVWSENRLLRTVLRRWNAYRTGDDGARLGRRNGAGLGEWPVWIEPTDRLARFEWGEFAQPPFDANGIPRASCYGVYGDDPHVVSTFGMHCFHALEAGNANHQRFLDVAAWLRDRLEIDDSGVGRYRVPTRNAAPRLSATAQANSISVLLRAHSMQADAGFDTAAAAAGRLFATPVADDGLLHCDGSHVVIGDCAERSSHGSLLGWLHALLALDELRYADCGDAEASARLCRRSTQTLVSVLAEYGDTDNPKHSRFDERTATLSNRYFIARQLEALARVTEVDGLKAAAKRWLRGARRTRRANLLSGTAAG